LAGAGRSRDEGYTRFSMVYYSRLSDQIIFKDIEDIQGQADGVSIPRIDYTVKLKKSSS
jgi:hypothetical protein